MGAIRKTILEDYHYTEQELKVLGDKIVETRDELRDLEAEKKVIVHQMNAEISELKEAFEQAINNYGKGKESRNVEVWVLNDYIAGIKKYIECRTGRLVATDELDTLEMQSQLNFVVDEELTAQMSEKVAVVFEFWREYLQKAEINNEIFELGQTYNQFVESIDNEIRLVSVGLNHLVTKGYIEPLNSVSFNQYYDVLKGWLGKFKYGKKSDKPTQIMEIVEEVEEEATTEQEQTESENQEGEDEGKVDDPNELPFGE